METIHNVPNSRQVLATGEDTQNLDAITRAFLKPGQCWNWHKHNKIDEIAIILKGEGKVGYNCKELKYKKNDVIKIPAESIHKWKAISYSEFIFVRILSDIINL